MNGRLPRIYQRTVSGFINNIDEFATSIDKLWFLLGAKQLKFILEAETCLALCIWRCFWDLMISLRLNIISLILVVGSWGIDLADLHIGGHLLVQKLLRITLETVKRVQRIKNHLLLASICLNYGRIPWPSQLVLNIFFRYYIVLALRFEHQAVLEKLFVYLVNVLILVGTAIVLLAWRYGVLQVSIFDVLDTFRTGFGRLFYVDHLLINLWSNWLSLELIIVFGFESLGVLILVQFVGTLGLLFEIKHILLLLLFLHAMK